jgi:hypothetical protein
VYQYNMKPRLLIASGIILSILLLGWVFLFFASDETQEEFFNALNFGDTSGEGFILDELFGVEEPTPDGVLAPLRQLSLRRVAGYLPVPATASTTAHVYLVEAGTGHIYMVQTASGEEVRVSNITVPQANQVAVSDDARFAALKSESANSLTVIILPHGTTTLDSFLIDTNTFSFSFTDSNTLLFAEKQGSAVVTYSYNIEKRIQSKLFTVPFRDATIQWGDNGSGRHLIYPHTSAKLEGYLYSVVDSAWNRMVPSGYGLSAIGNDSYSLFTKRVDTSYQTMLLNYETGNSAITDFPFLPEKCAFGNEKLICGLSTIGYNEDSPDTWYSGEVYYSDELWMVNLDSNNTTFIIGLEAESSRALDVTTPKTMPDESAFLFVNKIDQSLWIYDGAFNSNVGDN